MYNPKYILPFHNELNELVEVTFLLKDYGGASTELIGASAGLQIRSTTSDDQKLSYILGQEAIISIFVPYNSTLSIRDLVAEQEDDWKVSITVDSKPIFKGWLVVEDNSQPFFDPPYTLQVRATDGLALLKGVDFKDVDGKNFEGMFTIGKLLAQILYKVSEGETNIRTYFNIFESSFSADDPIEQISLNVKTFEKGDGFDDCYTVLEKICRNLRCRLFYQDGYWHVVSLYEHLKTSFTFTEYVLWSVSFGIVLIDVVRTGTATFDAQIGHDQIITAIEEDAMLYLKVANKSAKLSFKYNYPNEIFCNQNFKIGDLISGLSSMPAYEAYALDCWIHGKTQVGNDFSNPGTPTNTAFAKQEYDAFHYKTDRYIVIPTEASNANSSYLISAPFYIGDQDILSVSVDRRVKNGYSGAETTIVFWVLLLADDGTFYTLDMDGLWYPTVSTFTSNVRNIQLPYASADTKDKFTNVSIESKSLPKTGTIKIVLNEGSFQNYPNQTWFKNIQITVRPYINNSFRPVTGDFNLSDQSKTIKQKLEEDVEISDSPKKAIKGAIFRQNGVDLCTPTWARAGVTESRRFTEIMSYIVYNHIYKQLEKIEGTFKGSLYINTDSDQRPAGYLNNYHFTDDDTVQPFILTSFDRNYGTGKWRGVFVSVGDFQIPEKYEFNYVFE